jgi:signal transduction histidine kinase
MVMPHTWLRELHTESTLADLPSHRYAASPLTTGSEVATAFDADPNLPGALICDGPRLVGMISRHVFFQRLSKQYSREIYLNRPIRILMDAQLPPPLCMPASRRISEAAAPALDRPHDQAYEPVVVRAADESVRLLDVYVLVRAQAHLLMMAHSAMLQSEKLASIGQLAAGVAHEINNPLAFATNNLSVLRRDAKVLAESVALYRSAHALIAVADPALSERLTDLDDRVDLAYTASNLPDLVDRAHEGLRRIQNIVKDLREFARADLGDWTDVDVNEGVASTANIIRGRANGAAVALDLDLRPVSFVHGNPGKLNQVVMNLLANAIDASRAGGRVWARTRSTPAGVVIEIQDEGAGIPPDVLERIFDPFFTTKPPGQGTGLGLSITYGIVRDHHGSIDVQSTPGRGTCVRVALPVNSTAATAAEPPSPVKVPVQA